MSGMWPMTLVRSVFEQRKNRRHDDLLKFEREQDILSHHLPDLVWELVFSHLTTNLQVAESCAEASLFFHDFIVQSFENVSLGPNQILPSVYREWWPKSYFRRSPTDFLLKLVDVKARISTFKIFVTTMFRPDNNVLNSFLEMQCGSLHTFHISCIGIGIEWMKPLVLTFPENNKLRVLKMVRSVTNNRSKSLKIPQPIYSVLPALESVTLSLWGKEEWLDFLPKQDSDERQVCETLKHLCFVDYGHSIYISFEAMWQAAKLFPNLDSLELPAKIVSDFPWWWLGRISPKTLTLNGCPDVHCFDKFITRYDKETCKAIFRNPESDPKQLHWEVEERKIRALYTAHGDNVDRLLESSRRWIQRRGQQVRYTFFELEELRIKCGDGKFGPTAVCIPDLLNMASLKTIDFCGSYPKHIPEEILNILRANFQVLCGENTETT